jgi:hypothetical protein
MRRCARCGESAGDCGNLDAGGALGRVAVLAGYARDGADKACAIGDVRMCVGRVGGRCLEWALIASPVAGQLACPPSYGHMTNHGLCIRS